VLLVSHDRRFLEAVTTRTIAVHDGSVDIYPGGFKDYTEQLARNAALAEPPRNEGKKASRTERAEPAEAKVAPNDGDDEARARSGRAVKRSASTRQSNPPPAAPKAAEDRKRVYEADRAASRAIERKKKRLKELEGEIARGEADLERMREELKQDPGGDWAKLAKMATEEQALTKRVDAAMTEWMTLSEELAGQGAQGEAT
jgi:ATP-binding cassette subfamily F protein 3